MSEMINKTFNIEIVFMSSILNNLFGYFASIIHQAKHIFDEIPTLDFIVIVFLHQSCMMDQVTASFYRPLFIILPRVHNAVVCRSFNVNAFPIVSSVL